MGTVDITLSEYYYSPQYYGAMPIAIFNALELAFLEGKETATVPKVEFETMVNNIHRETA
ncbi:MAG: hypothetical protein LBT94_02770 [Prevotellaceae bacterium]|jgi:hypothetical protein|nr:hypothetical protein [Prevotellaceae bacterium]